jgi:predicted esterase
MGTTPTELFIRVTRSARYFVSGDPSPDTREVWIVLHGYAQLAEPFLRAFAPVAAEHRVVVAPEALSRFYLDEPAKRHGPDSPIGAGWMTREDRENEIADYVAYLDVVAAKVMPITPKARITVLGFSQGVATACRWLALGKVRAERLILWGGAIAADLPVNRGDQLFNGAAVTLVAGQKDAIVPVTFMQKEQKALAKLGVTATLVEHAGGHALNSETLRELSARP